MYDDVKGLQTWSQLKRYILDEIASNIVELKKLLRQKSLSIENPRSESTKEALEDLKNLYFSDQKFIVLKRFS